MGTFLRWLWVFTQYYLEIGLVISIILAIARIYEGRNDHRSTRPSLWVYLQAALACTVYWPRFLFFIFFDL